MRWTACGLVAILSVGLMSGMLATGAVAQVGEAESEAILEFRAALTDELAEAETLLATYNEHITGADWYLVKTPDSGPVAVRLSTLDDHVPAARYFRDHPNLLDEVNDAVHTWDTEFLMAVGLVLDATGPGDDLALVAAELRQTLEQTKAEKKDIYRPVLRALRKDRDQARSAIEWFDGVIAAMGVPPAPEAEPVTTMPLPEGELGVIEAFRDYLAASAADVRGRIVRMREKLEDPNTIVLRNSDAFPTEVSFDLDRLASYESVFAHMYETDDWWTFWDHDMARVQDLFIAQWLANLWGTPPDWYDDWVEEVDQMDGDDLGLRWQIDKEKFYRPIIRRLWPERDALDRGIEIVDGLIVEVTAIRPEATPGPMPEPTPGPTSVPTPPPTPEPTPQSTPEPTPETVLEPTPAETPIADPFADL